MCPKSIWCIDRIITPTVWSCNQTKNGLPGKLPAFKKPGANRISRQRRKTRSPRACTRQDLSQRSMLGCFRQVAVMGESARWVWRVGGTRFAALSRDAVGAGLFPGCPFSGQPVFCLVARPNIRALQLVNRYQIEFSPDLPSALPFFPGNFRLFSGHRIPI